MVYQATTKSLIEGVISGYNATVFAYGPTGEGNVQTVGEDCNAPVIPVTLQLVRPQLGQESRMWSLQITPRALQPQKPHPEPGASSAPLPTTSLAI